MITREKELKKLAKIGRALLDTTIYVPSHEIISRTLAECEKEFTGKGTVNWSYARNVAIGEHYAYSASNLCTAQILAADIKAGKRIFLNNYK